MNQVNFIKIIKKAMERFFYRILQILFTLVKVNKKKIVVISYYGKPYGDNGKYIINELLKLDATFEIVWLLNKKYFNNIQFHGIKYVKYKSIKALYHMASSKIWIDNCRKGFVPIKKKSQYYIQTWHGSVALKKIEKDAVNLPKSYIKMAINDSKIADVILSNGKWSTNMYKQSFWFHNNIIEVGTPRCDALFNNQINVKLLKTKLGILNKYVLLYAPTFRDNQETSIYDVDLESLKTIVETKTDKEWVILYRLHPNISHKKIDNILHSINVSEYEDMYELLSLTDILVTDYSSTMFEFMHTRKPVMLYAPDIDEYEKERGFYFKLESLPFPLAINNSQLLNNFRDFDFDNYVENLNQFIEEIGCFEDGKASKRVAKLIIERIKYHE